MPVTATTVPCGSCRLCCKGDAIFLHPEHGDDPSQYKTVRHTAAPGRDMLAHKPNGDCVYLDDKTGCTIHGNAPAICREFDCRSLAKNLGYTKGRKMVKRGMLDAAVLRRGRALIAGGR